MAPVQVAVVAVQELAQERVRVPVKERAKTLARELARAVIISAQLPVLNLVRDVPDVADAEVPAALDAQIVVREPAKVVVLLDAEVPAAVVQGPAQQIVKAIAAGRVATSASDRQRYQYIHFRR